MHTRFIGDSAAIDPEMKCSLQHLSLPRGLLLLPSASKLRRQRPDHVALCAHVPLPRMVSPQMQILLDRDDNTRYLRTLVYI